MLPPPEYTAKRLFLRKLNFEPDFVDAIKEQQQRHIELCQLLHLLGCQTNRFRGAEWYNNDSRIPALGVSLNIRWLLSER
jgi:hypothetical protein